ncbi:hypothetical protein T4D_5982 [Trichinella pseudospiralis]|uniref:Uncharacterized protein n=1 Tax=Trichinella pseudospiralis TaxID=6337 RepID=A0A0V1FN58_TRIPS|nr:hypothetical protein T4D_5982 [Trichinella pseudospiralis]
MGCNVTGDAFCPRICRIDFLSTASRISYQFILLLFFLIGPTLWKVWKKKKKQLPFSVDGILLIENVLETSMTIFMLASRKIHVDVSISVAFSA